MTQIKKKDFVEVEYTGTIKDDNAVFDTTDEKLAKKANIHNKEMNYGPLVICVGEQQILVGLDKALEGKEPGEYKIELKPEDAFGKKSAKLIQLVQTSKFLKQNIRPVPGLQVNIDGMFGLIRTVSGGRTLVDFNHPLAGKEIAYSVKVNRIIENDKEKIEAYLKLALNLKEVNVKIENNEAKIELKDDIPKEIREEFSRKISELIPAIKKMDFIIKKEEKGKAEQKKEEPKPKI